MENKKFNLVFRGRTYRIYYNNSVSFAKTGAVSVQYTETELQDVVENSNAGILPINLIVPNITEIKAQVEFVTDKTKEEVHEEMENFFIRFYTRRGIYGPAKDWAEVMKWNDHFVRMFIRKELNINKATLEYSGNLKGTEFTYPVNVKITI